MWYAVQTKPRCEEKALARIQACGLEAFLPMVLLEGKRGVRRREPEPLFPSYLFVRLDPTQPELDRVKWAPGVKRILGCGDDLVPVPDEAVQLIKGRTGEKGYIRQRAKPVFLRGSTVRVRGGPFAGLLAVVEEPMPRAGRVRVLLSLLRRETSVELEEACLTAL